MRLKLRLVTKLVDVGRIHIQPRLDGSAEGEVLKGSKWKICEVRRVGGETEQVGQVSLVGVCGVPESVESAL